MASNGQLPRETTHPRPAGSVHELGNGTTSGANQSSSTAQNRPPSDDQASYHNRTLTPPSLPYSGTFTTYESAAAAAAAQGPSGSQHLPLSHAPVHVPLFANTPPGFFPPPPQQQQQHQPQSTPQPASPVPGSSANPQSADASPSGPSTTPKRKLDETEDFGTPKSNSKTVRKRRMRVNLAAVESAEAGTTGDSTNDGGVVGGRENGGGAKHWTDEEKGKLFVWMLASDEHWGAFANQMNSVFREAATVLFEGKKSFTALKSCYHRNVETFKQIYAFNKFLCTSLPSNPGDLAGPINTNSATSSDPSSTASGSNAQDILHAPIPASFSSPIHRQTFLERKLEAGRSVANIPVANLNIKVVDHWYKLGWFELFRRRYRPDVTGNILPYHGPDPPPPDPLAHIFPPPPPHIIAAFQGNMQSISGQELVANGDQSGQEEEEGGSGDDELEEGEGGNKDSPNRPSSSRNRASSQGSRALQPPTHPQAPYSMNGHMQPAQPPPMGYPYPYPPPDNGAHYYAAYKPSPYAPPLPPQPPSPHMQQTLGHLTSLTQTLITSCNTLTELLRTQVEEGKAWKDLLKKAEEREARRDQQSVTSGDLLLDKKEKAGLAAEVLAKQGVDEEVRQAAAAYLKRLFDGG